MNKIKTNAKNFIVDEACKLFLEKSITDVTMSEIAKEVGVGEATMYRYFGTKQNVIMAVAVKLATDVFENYFAETNHKNGFEKLKAFYETYLYIFRNHNSYFSFVREFDAFILTDAKDKKDYEFEVDMFKANFIEAYNLGVADNSIKAVENVEQFYYATTHALLNLCKTLSNKALLSQDEMLSKEAEIQTLIDIYLYKLAA